MKLSDERLKAIMDECDKYEITLAHDPTVLGPSYLQDMIARCRNFTNHTVMLLNEVKRSKMALDKDLRRKKAMFKISSDEYLAKNPVVRNLPNIKDREAQINLMLKSEHQEITTFENDILDLEHVEDVVKLRHRELKDTMREIQTQRALIRDDRETGSAYGDERPGMGVEDADVESAYTPGGRTREDKADDKEIERMILEGFGGPSEALPEVTPEPTVTAPSPKIEEVASTSTAPSETPKSDEDMIRDFLDQGEETPITATPKDEDSSPSIPVSTSNSLDDDMADLIANL